MHDKAARRIELAARLQGDGVIAGGELLDLGDEGGEVSRTLARQAIVVPGGRRVGRQGGDVGLFGAGVELRPVGGEVEIEDLGEQDDAVEIDVVLGLQGVDQDRRSRRAVAFPKQVLGRAVLGEKAHDELAKGVGVGIDAVEGLLLVLAGDPRKTGPRRVDEHQVADVQQAVGVVDERVGSGRSVGIVAGLDASWPKGAHVQPYRRGARTAIVEEGYRPPGRGNAVLEVGDVEHRRLGLGILVGARALVGHLLGGLVGGLRVLAPGLVVPALGMDDDGSGHRPVVHALALDVHAPETGDALGREDHAVVGFRGVGRRRLGIFALGRLRRRFGGDGRRRRQRQAGGEKQHFTHRRKWSSSKIPGIERRNRLSFRAV